jgi:NTE family protein
MEATQPRQAYQDELARQHIVQFLGNDDPAAVQLLLDHLDWVELAGGDTLMKEGDPGDSMYLSLSGRLRAYKKDANGRPVALRDLGRGQIIGEMSLYTGEPRSATVMAVRDSVVVRIGKEAFHKLLASSTQASIALTRQLIQRLQSQGQSPGSPMARPVTMAIVAITQGADLTDFGAELAGHMARAGRVMAVDSHFIRKRLQAEGLQLEDARTAVAGNPESPETMLVTRQVARILDQVEAEHDFVLLLADPEDSYWTRRCMASADEILLLAKATEPRQLHPLESEALVGRSSQADVPQILVLLHDADTTIPHDTAAWLQRRPVADHVHLRVGDQKDMARLARIQSGTAVGLVMAGGGARGLAHLGVYRALLEKGVEVDCVGGTSIGGIMAILLASGRPYEHVMDIAQRAFKNKPTSDFSWLPIFSLIKGQRLRRIVETSMDALLGAQGHLEDCWKSCYCIATNYSTASEVVLRQGNASRALLASCAIPGALPPVIENGDILCDGGTFNNFPVDTMRQMRGVGTVIGVDLSLGRRRKLRFRDLPDTWQLLRDRMKPRHRRRYKLPSLTGYLMNMTILYSVSRQSEYKRLTDLYLNPPVLKAGMLSWSRMDSIVRQGYEHGVEVLGKVEPRLLARIAPAAV